MKILLISDFFPTGKDLRFSGGVEARTFFVAKHLAKKNEVSVICSRQPGLKKQESFSSIEVYRVGPEMEYGTGLPQLLEFPKRISFIFDAIKVGKSLQTDIVDGGNWSDHFIAKKIADSRKIPIVYWYPDVFFGQWVKVFGIIGGFIGYLLEKYNLYKSSDCHIAISEITKKKLVKAGVEELKIKVVPCGVDPAEFNQRINKSKIPQIICISRLVSYKRVKDLILAFALVNRKVSDSRLLIIGSGPEKKKLQNLSRELKLLNKIKFLENLPREDLINKLKESNLFVLPSGVEGFGISVIEAAAAGVPYVVSDIEVFKEVTKNAKGGLLFKLGDISDLAKKLETLLLNNKLYASKSEDGLALAKFYNWADIAKETENIYKQLIKNR